MSAAEWMTVQDVAALLGVRIETVRRWIRSGDLPVLELGGSRTVYRVRRADLAEFVQDRFAHSDEVGEAGLARMEAGEPATADEHSFQTDTVAQGTNAVIEPETFFRSDPDLPSPRHFVEHAPAITFREPVLNPESAPFMSREIESLLGYPAEHFSNSPGFWRAYIHPDDRRAVDDELARTDATGERFTMEYRMVRSDGQTTWIRVNAILTDDFGSGGKVWEGTIEDVTERHRLEMALRSRERQQLAVADLGRQALDGKTVTVLFERAVRHLVEALEVDLAMALEVLPGGNAMALRARDVSTDAAPAAGYHGPDVDPLSVFALGMRDTVTCDDLTVEARFDGSALSASTGARSGAAVVIPGRFRPFGVLTVLSVLPRHFIREDVGFLQSFAHVIASAAVESGGHWLTVGEVSEFLQVTEDTVRRWIRHSELPALNLGGPRAGYRVYPTDLERFIQQRLSRN